MIVLKFLKTFLAMFCSNCFQKLSVSKMLIKNPHKKHADITEEYYFCKN